jgi:hypothetical protein
MLNLETFIRLFNPEFSMKVAILGEIAGSDTRRQSLIDDLMPYFTMFIILIFVVLVLTVIMIFSPRYNKKMKNTLRSIKNFMFFNGIIRCIYISFLPMVLAIFAQFYLWATIKDALNGADKFRNIVLVLVLLAINVWTYFLVFKKRQLLQDKDKKDSDEFKTFYLKFSNIISKIHLYRSMANIYYYPIFLTRRIVYAFLAYALAAHPYFQI